ncbi:prephenate dehydrogenase [Falsigemmobacter faecalis]|uniref:Prephenate dehydrogenase n=1 Tax=Falsigemmobacter faecalis TaxID=2488730 RepID=A0A3P3DW22_9RHOB|nr:prephenate dehydrogenase [Falsigemmobacter faecalis]RRH78437.1 prephenate dehydrogenase [Falsigemmobacter faecalis]
MQHPTLALIGFGAFGRLTADLLKAHCRILICDPSEPARTAARHAGLRVISLPEVAEADIVLLCLPLPQFGQTLSALAPHLRPGQLVADVASVKSAPAALMQNLLPDHVELLATHPMFGPQSAAAGTRGLQLVLCPLRGGSWRRRAAFLRKTLGLRLLITTPDQHDRDAARTQGLTHLLARALRDLGPAPKLRTRSFELLDQAFAMVRDDAPEVFEAVTRDNPHVAPLQARLADLLAAASG